MICKLCSYETERLLVKEWHSFLPDEYRQDLTAVVAAMLTPPVTRSLPAAWHDDFTLDRARQWIRNRDDESSVLLAVTESDREAVGLIILHEIADEDDPDAIEVRIGYLLAESAWGRGYASELVSGFVGWCREQPAITLLAGGVERDNPASARVLEKSGFHPADDDIRDVSREQMFVLRLR